MRVHMIMVGIALLVIAALIALFFYQQVPLIEPSTNWCTTQTTLQPSGNPYTAVALITITGMVFLGAGCVLDPCDEVKKP
jgi:hypothetical protein